MRHMTHYVTHYMTHHATHYTTHYTTHYSTHYTTHCTTHYMGMHTCSEKTTFQAKTTSATLYIYIGVGSRDLFIDEAHTALGKFPVFFPCMLPTPLCGIFKINNSSSGFILIFISFKNHVQQHRVPDQFFNYLNFYTPPP